MITMNNMKRIIIVGMMALIGACDGLGTGLSDGEARVSILLTDAPGDLSAAVVTITDIYLQPGEGDDAQRIYLRQGAGITTDLLTLSNDVLELVDSRTVPAGEYEQMRFVITGGYIEVETGTGSTIYASSPNYEGLPPGAEVDGNLIMPSFGQSGLKVILNGGSDDEDDGSIVLEGEQTLLVDFDVSESFGHAAGMSGNWVMRPALKATSVQSAATVTVTVALAEGVTLPLIEGVATTLASFNATLAPSDDGDAKVVAFSDADGDGVFEAKFLYLFPGSYAVGFAGPEALSFTLDLATPVDLTLGSGQAATVGFELTSASLE
jgi:hypothetical protein